MMADIAAVFTWAPPVLDAMSWDELVTWHRRAVARFKSMNGVA